MVENNGDLKLLLVFLNLDTSIQLGNGHAIDHFHKTAHSLACKLSTLKEDV